MRGYKASFKFITGKETMMEALDLLTHNAENLRHAVEEVLYSTERAIIKLPSSDKERLGLLKMIDLTEREISESHLPMLFSKLNNHACKWRDIGMHL